MVLLLLLLEGAPHTRLLAVVLLQPCCPGEVLLQPRLGKAPAGALLQQRLGRLLQPLVGGLGLGRRAASADAAAAGVGLACLVAVPPQSLGEVPVVAAPQQQQQQQALHTVEAPRGAALGPHTHLHPRPALEEGVHPHTGGVLAAVVPLLLAGGNPGDPPALLPAAALLLAAAGPAALG